MNPATVPNATIPTSDPAEARLSLLGGLDTGELDGVLPGGVYAVVPQSPPARFPLWANLLKSATDAGRVCHVLIRTDPADFLERIKSAGWPEVHQAWMKESLRLYPMADGFAKLLFRMDVEGLTNELTHWGVEPHDMLLVDAADELLSLHDLFLATSQLVKFKAWAKDTQVHVLLNFALAGAASGQAGLTSLMDHFSGLARLHSDSEGPVVTLEYWQSAMGTSAERTVRLQVVAGAYQLRLAGAPISQRNGVTGDRRSAPRTAEPSVASDNFTNDQVWARELQMLTGTPWKSLPGLEDLRQAALASRMPLLVLRFAPDTVLAELARSVHALRSGSNPTTRIVVAEHRVSLRYANELMLLRLGADAVIRQDVALDRWPVVLSGLQSQPPRPKPDVDVQTALANAASPQGKGYLEVPGFLSEVEAALERGHVLGVPFALAVLRARSDQAIADAVASAHFRRNGDFLTTDGEKLFVFFNACSLTRGPQVLDSIFEGRLLEFVAGIDWMASEIDIQQLMKNLQVRHRQHPFQLALQERRPGADPARVPETSSVADQSSVQEPEPALAAQNTYPAVLPVLTPVAEVTAPPVGLARMDAPDDSLAEQMPPPENTSDTRTLSSPSVAMFPLGRELPPTSPSAVVPAPGVLSTVVIDAPVHEAVRSRPNGVLALNGHGQEHPVTEPAPVPVVPMEAEASHSEVDKGVPVTALPRSAVAAKVSGVRPHVPAPSVAVVPLPVPARLAARSGVHAPAPEPRVGELIRRLAGPPTLQTKKAPRLGGHF